MFEIFTHSVSCWTRFPLGNQWNWLTYSLYKTENVFCWNEISRNLRMAGIVPMQSRWIAIPSLQMVLWYHHVMRLLSLVTREAFWLSWGQDSWRMDLQHFSSLWLGWLFTTAFGRGVSDRSGTSKRSFPGLLPPGHGPLDLLVRDKHHHVPGAHPEEGRHEPGRQQNNRNRNRRMSWH